MESNLFGKILKLAGVFSFVALLGFAEPDSIVYVSLNGSSTAPYDEPGKGFASIEEGVAYAQSLSGSVLVYVDEGMFELATGYLNVTKPIHIQGRGVGRTIIKPVYNPSNQKSMAVNNVNALIENLSIVDGNGAGANSGGIDLTAGKIVGCLFARNTGNQFHGGALYMKNNDCFVSNCVFASNRAVGSGMGGAIYMDGGGLVYDSIITNNYAEYSNGAYPAGGGVYMYTGSGLLKRCVVANNSVKSTAYGAGVGVDSGRVEECVITNNVGGKFSGGVSIKAGKVYNCLIVANESVYGGGVYMTGGELINCTITKNRSEPGMSAGLFVNGASAIVENNIIWDNGRGVSENPLCNIEVRSVKTYSQNIVNPASGLNIASDPLFVSPEKSDFRLFAVSPAIDAVSSSLFNDIMGNVRPYNLKGGADALSDIGCFEMTESVGVDNLDCTISASNVIGYGELLTTFTALLLGEKEDINYSYEWNFGEGCTILSEEDNGRIVNVRYNGYGARDVGVVVSGSDQSSASAERKDFIKIGAQKAYVNHFGNGTWPFATPETATNDLCEVVNTMIISGDVLCDIEIDDGNYPINEKYANIITPIRVYGKNGREHTFVYGNNDTNPKAAFYVDHPMAVVEGITVTNCPSAPSEKGVVSISRGTFKDSVLCCSTGGWGTLYITQNGKGENLFVHSNSSAYGGGVYIEYGGMLENCIVSNNISSSEGGGCYLYSTGTATIKNCQIINNSVIGHKAGGGIYSSATQTELLSTIVTGNSAPNSNSGAVLFPLGSNVTMVNCLLVDNRSKNTPFGCSFANANIINSTIANNEPFNPLNEGAMCNVTDKTKICNSIFFADSGTIFNNASAIITNSCISGFEVVPGSGNINVNPKFKGLGVAPYSLCRTSECINAGNSDYFDFATFGNYDIIGNRRVFNIIDMGCYELMPQKGTVIKLR